MICISCISRHAFLIGKHENTLSSTTPLTPLQEQGHCNSESFLLKLVEKIRKRNLCRIPDFLPRFCDFFFLNYGPIESYTDRLFHPGSPPSPRWTHFLCSSHLGLLVALQMRQTLWPAVHCSFLRMLCPTSPT